MAFLEWGITIAVVATALFFVIRSVYRSATGKDGCAGCGKQCPSRKSGNPDKPQ